MIQFLYFDAGFTLLHPYPSVGWHYAREAEKLGLGAFSADKLESAFRPAWKSSVKDRTGAGELPYGRNLDEARLFWNSVVAECFRIAGYQPPNEPRYFDHIFDHFCSPECWKLYDDVIPALNKAREAGLKLGILSNWDQRLRLVIEGMGLGDRFEQIIVSSDVGAEKPRREIFQFAKNAAGVNSDNQVALIGDEPEADGWGALYAGWKQCLVDRSIQAKCPEGLHSEEDLVSAVSFLLRENTEK